MKVELTEDDVRRMCIYLKGHEETITCETRMVNEGQRVLENPTYVYGSFLLTCHPDIIEKFIEDFSFDGPDGHCMSLLKDPVRDPYSLSAIGKIRYHCVTLLLPERDLFVTEVIATSSTIIPLGNYASDGHRFTIFIPMIHDYPFINVYSFLWNESPDSAGIGMAYDRYAVT